MEFKQFVRIFKVQRTIARTFEMGLVLSKPVVGVAFSVLGVAGLVAGTSLLKEKFSREKKESFLHQLGVSILTTQGESEYNHEMHITNTHIVDKLKDKIVHRFEKLDLLKINDVHTAVLDQEDVVSFFDALKVDNSTPVSLMLHYTYTDEYESQKENTIIAQLKFSEGSDLVVEDIDVEDVLLPCPIITRPNSDGTYYTEEECLIQHYGSELYIKVTQDGKLKLDVLGDVSMAVFTRHQAAGYMERNSHGQEVIKNGSRVTVNLFIKKKDIFRYITNTTENTVGLMSRGNRIDPKHWDERDPRFYYCQPVPGTVFYVFMSTCFENHYLAFTEVSKEPFLLKVTDHSKFVNGCDSAKFMLHFENPCQYETSV